MWAAFMWGGISASAVVIGALAALFLKIPKRVIGWIMAFGTGTLIGAASFELIGDALNDGGIIPTAIGFTAGAVVYTLFDLLISSKGGGGRKRSAHSKTGDSSQSGLGIFAGTVMDAIPESIMLGASLLTGKGVSVVLIVSIFVSNIPEGLSSTVGLRGNHYSKSRIIVMWLGVLLISALAALGGYLFLEQLPDEMAAAIGAFAGGGIIAMICSTMMPEAFEEGGPVVGFIASMGLLVSLLLDL
ncbi:MULTISPECIES: ZIP family metal transporter [Paenibacillus]|uniref:ZIP family metal transporter n=1 Tax=Paenibacillus TaxID=44249 RepID=UPI00129E0D56|nr:MULTISPECIES: ZIP family metal transporter [Paenibacillus]MBY0220533.1 ZIP family metal transporter [Paenibacillus illinoisensis]WJH28782.1 ZIP family metal transporter [Paenibacillus sp. CC-CFT742]